METVRVSGIFVECEGKFLILKRRNDISQPGKWGLPAGRIKSGETELEAAIRELREETGYEASPAQLNFISKSDWHFPGKRVIYYRFNMNLEKPFDVRLTPKEHVEFRWITRDEFRSLKNPIHGLKKLVDES